MNVPAWQGVRSRDFLYVRNADGFEELYRTSDVFQLDNLAAEPVRGTPAPSRPGRVRRVVRRHTGVDSRAMQNGPPIIRPSSLRRPTRSQLARRRAGVVVVVVLLLVGIWQFWPAGGSGGTDVGASGSSSTTTDSAGPSPSTIVPGANPIEHVVFLVKENHSFDNYFGSYPGADGATEGPTLQVRPGLRARADGAADLRAVHLPARPGPRVRSRSDRDQRRQDGRLQLRHLRRGPHRLHAVRSQDAARLLGARRPVRAGRPLLHVDVRPDVPGAPLHDRGAVLRHRRQQDHDRHRGQLLRRPSRAHTAVPDRGPHDQGHQDDHGPRGPVPRQPGEPVQDRRLLGRHAHLHRHPDPPRPATEGARSAGSTTRTRTSG